jgi:hypothetical protein
MHSTLIFFWMHLSVRWEIISVKIISS